MNPINHVGNIRLLRPVVVPIEYQEYCQTKNDRAKNEEEPEEFLRIASETGLSVFLVLFLNTLAFISKHFIDLADMLLHLSSHPFVFFGIMLLNLFLDFIHHFIEVGILFVLFDKLIDIVCSFY